MGAWPRRAAGAFQRVLETLAVGAGLLHVEWIILALFVRFGADWAALLCTAAARAGFEPRLERSAADLTTKVAMVAAGYAVAPVPGVLVSAMRLDVVPVRFVDAPTRGIHVTLPSTVDPGREVDELVAALRQRPPLAP